MIFHNFWKLENTRPHKTPLGRERKSSFVEIKIQFKNILRKMRSRILHFTSFGQDLALINSAQYERSYASNFIILKIGELILDASIDLNLDELISY